MTVRKILSARAAKAQVDDILAALVDAAVFIGRADGRFSEDELDVFIDTMREVISSAVGDDFVGEFASTPRLLDLARVARQRLKHLGASAYLEELAPRVPAHLQREALVLAYRVVMADGQVTPDEAASYRALAQAFGVAVHEADTLEDLAAKSEAASRQGHRGGAIEEVQALEAQGWADPYHGRTPRPPEAEWFDVVLEAPGAPGTRLLLELDATESVLHLQVLGADGQGPHLIFLYAGTPAGLLAVVNAVKGALSPETFRAQLPAFKAVCPDLFLELGGTFSKV